MNLKPIILVTGATGAQGGSIAYALLKEGKFAVRALSRNAQSEKALALQEAGATVVEGDLNDVQALKKAMQGCYGVFGVTSFLEHYEHEYNHGKNLIDAVKQSHIQHFVFSTQPDYSKLTNGTFNVPHYDLKAILAEYTKSLKIPSTFVHPAFYYENFLSFFSLQKTKDGGYQFGFPQGDTRLAMVSVADMGGVVAAIFNHPAEYMDRTVGIVGEDRSCAEYAAIMSRVLGKDIWYQHVPHEVFADRAFPMAEEWANMFEVQRLCIPTRQLDLIESYGLNPAMQTLEKWLQKNKAKFEAHFQQLEASTLHAMV
ncbi:NmrA/HSCARG family protein [Haliscomenobacter hydrossis]|uniref:NmrA-like family domain containing 1 n=1 Tax=Haliscomenobacter hydrossis (strain ATCC 27775 / DSM 1100 / LMG 10767 / O) TaxID=760192 RepID=F4KZW4_HALH1|nr:NmrA/HSCARG family protein [Haliscomenobacter hydrossis]AEE51534.1 NmrA-like family domain containing 1 [Haliscomenobacter hydrossis DSM 1100]